jgi:GntR family carbon starvation induced transcriptional regulator
MTYSRGLPTEPFSVAHEVEAADANSNSVADGALSPHLTERVLRDLRRGIVSGDMAPGTKLQIRELAARLGTSPIPVREALRALSEQGLVDMSSYRVAVVAPVSVTDLEDVYLLRAELESIATREAALRGDATWLSGVHEAYDVFRKLVDSSPHSGWEAYEVAHRGFHQSIYRGYQSKWLLQFINLLSDASERYHRLFGSAEEMWHRGTLDKHKEILTWLDAGEADIAASLVRLHAQKSQVAMRGVLQRQGKATGALHSSRPRTDEARASTLPTTAQGPAGSFRDLTVRQLQLLAELAAGKSDAAIALALGWSSSAVERELAAMYRRLGFSNTGHLNQRVAAALIYLKDTRATSS